LLIIHRSQKENPMSEKFFKYEDTLVVCDIKTFKLYMLIGDTFLEISDDSLRNKIRFYSQEISPETAFKLSTDWLSGKQLNVLG
jgi:hypothetical protein